jgi:hypothetical protein
VDVKTVAVPSPSRQQPATTVPGEDLSQPAVGAGEETV